MGRENVGERAWVFVRRRGEGGAAARPAPLAHLEVLAVALRAEVALPDARGALSQYVQSPWFNDPLLKTIKYLENIH